MIEDVSQLASVENMEGHSNEKNSLESCRWHIPRVYRSNEVSLVGDHGASEESLERYVKEIAAPEAEKPR
jgi:hypothetical protein